MADHTILRYREKADKWVQQAETSQRRVYMDTITHFKFEDASNYQEQAAQCFRVAKRFQDAGVAYKNAGRMEEKLKKPDVAASFYHEAALCFQKDDPQEAATCYLAAINLYCQIRRFSTAARLETKVAEIMGKDRNRPLEISHYMRAAYFYAANTCCDKAADRCRLKAARSLGLSGWYLEAADLFEEVGHRLMSDDLLKFNSPETFLRALLCLICASGIPQAARVPLKKDEPAPPPPRPRPTPKSIKSKLSVLGKASPMFKGSRECAFGSDVARAAKEGDMELFATSVYAYDNVCRLDAGCLRLLKTISGHVEELSVKLAKMRAMQEKLRRRQAAAERDRGRLKSRRPDPLSISGDSHSGASGDSSSGETQPTGGGTQEPASRSLSASSSSSKSGSSSSSQAGSSDTGSSSTGSSGSNSGDDYISGGASCSPSADASSPADSSPEEGGSGNASSESNSESGSGNSSSSGQSVTGSEEDEAGSKDARGKKKQGMEDLEQPIGRKDTMRGTVESADGSANESSGDDGSGSDRRASSSVSTHTRCIEEKNVERGTDTSRKDPSTNKKSGNIPKEKKRKLSVKEGVSDQEKSGSSSRETGSGSEFHGESTSMEAGGWSGGRSGQSVDE